MKYKSIVKYSPLIFLITFALSALAGCDTADGTSLSSEAVILDYASDYLAEAPVIDVPNRTVTVTVQPMDLSGFAPIITLSGNARLTVPAAIEDGVPATYTVTAENGSSAEWTVTVNVQYGISYNLGGTRVVHTGCVIDTNDENQDTSPGDEVPGIFEGRGRYIAYIYERTFEPQNYTSLDSLDFDYSNLSLSEVTTDTYTGTLGYSDYSESTYSYFDIDSNIKTFESIGGDMIMTFTGEESMDKSVTRAELIKVTGGFAKLKVIAGPQ